MTLEQPATITNIGEHAQPRIVVERPDFAKADAEDRDHGHVGRVERIPAGQRIADDADDAREGEKDGAAKQSSHGGLHTRGVAFERLRQPQSFVGNLK